MLTVLFSWVIICGAALLFGKAVVDSVYKNRLEVMGRPVWFFFLSGCTGGFFGEKISGSFPAVLG